MNSIRKFVLSKGGQAGILLAKAFICVCALQDSALKLLQCNDDISSPVLRYFDMFFGQIRGWGMEKVIVYVGIFCILYFAGKSSAKNNRYLIGLSLFFSICTVIGRSYIETNSWIYIFSCGMQFVSALLVAVGYYILYKNVILLCHFFIQSTRILEIREGRNRVERFLFEEHPFGGALLVFAVFAIPYVIIFFPGTLHRDALWQLMSFTGDVEWTGVHPMLNSWHMGGCMMLGKRLFGSSNVGLFLYSFPQYVAQWLVFAYGFLLICRMKTPVLMRWGGALRILPYFRCGKYGDTQ